NVETGLVQCLVFFRKGMGMRISKDKHWNLPVIVHIQLQGCAISYRLHEKCTCSQVNKGGTTKSSGPFNIPGDIFVFHFKNKRRMLSWVKRINSLSKKLPLWKMILHSGIQMW